MPTSREQHQTAYDAEQDAATRAVEVVLQDSSQPQMARLFAIARIISDAHLCPTVAEREIFESSTPEQKLNVARDLLLCVLNLAVRNDPKYRIGLPQRK